MLSPCVQVIFRLGVGLLGVVLKQLRPLLCKVFYIFFQCVQVVLLVLLLMQECGMRSLNNSAHILGEFVKNFDIL